MQGTITIEDGSAISTNLEARFSVVGTTWLISSNSPEILAAAKETFPDAADSSAAIDLTVRLVVNPALVGKTPWPKPYFRGLDHLVYAAYDQNCSMLVDLLRRRVIGEFSPAMAVDRAYWKRVLLPVLLGIVSAPIGVTPLHCACLVKKGQGLIIGGESGAGKSTLSLALGLNGFSYLSDDWTYFSQRDVSTRAWGLPTAIKLLPDTQTFFPQLEGKTPAPSLNGELAFEVDPEIFSVSRSLSCEPRWLVFVDRKPGEQTKFEPIGSAEAADRFLQELEMLPPSLAQLRTGQAETVRRLVDRKCWKLTHSLLPNQLGLELARFCESSG